MTKSESANFPFLAFRQFPDLAEGTGEAVRGVSRRRSGTNLHNLNCDRVL